MKKEVASKTACEWSQKTNPPIMDPLETDLLIKYVKKCKIHFVEIGTYKGGSAALISKYLSENVRLTTIDIFDKPPRGSIPPDGKLPTYEDARSTIIKEGNIKKVKIIKGVSWSVVKKWKKNIDILFIDGDHRYKAVKRDFNIWEPYVIKGGYILIHDINFPGISKVFKEILENPKFLLKERSGNLAVIEKK